MHVRPAGSAGGAGNAEGVAPEELAALHSKRWIPSVPATYAYHTIQYFVTSIDAGMPMHVAFTLPIVTNCSCLLRFVEAHTHRNG